MNRAFRAAFLLLTVAGPLASAQEILVSDPVLVPVSTSTADQPAKVLSKELPHYPQAWKASQTPHWAALGFLLDAKGAIVRSSVDCEKEMEKDLGKAASNWRFVAGTHRGKSVQSACRIVLIFNPAAENRAAPDAPVRIASGLFTPPIPLMKGFTPSLQFTLRLKVGENGQVQVLQLEPLAERYARAKALVRAAYDAPEVAAAVRATVEHWTFTPARRAGQPIATEIPLVVTAPSDNFLDFVPPKVLTQVRPIYPLSMRKSQNRGEVLLDFVVDAKGAVQNPIVLRSTHPDFEAPAVAALLKWTFAPSTVGGKPAATHLQCPIFFTLTTDSLDDSSPGGQEAYSIGAFHKASSSYPFDLQAQPKLVVSPVYPLEFLKREKFGKATIRMLVGQTGTVLQAVVMKASDPEFGHAAAAAVLCWTFEPATLAGKPVPTVLQHEFSFNATDRDFALDDAADDFLSLLKRHPEQIAKLGQLDSIPKTLYRVLPIFPRGAPSGQVRVEFYVDRTGKVRFPHALQSSSDDLVYPALTAVSRWQFDPPLRNGKPADAVVEIPIVWTAK